MRSRFLASLTLPVVLFAASMSTIAHAAVRDRIAGTINSGSRVAMPGMIMARAKNSTDLGLAPANTKLNSLSLHFSMTAAQQADLTQLLAAQLNPSSPSYHQWLTPEQFGARFGLSSADLAKVSSWLTSQGFTITSVARSSTSISFTGTVAQAQTAFGTTIHSLSYNGEQHISNITDPVVPSAIASVVGVVNGLNDFKLKPRSRARHASAIDPSQPLYTQTANGTTSHYISPADLYTIYDFNPLPTSSTPAGGTGVTIAVMGQTDLSANPDPNITQFRAAAGLPAINLQLQLVGPDPGLSTADIDEAHIDIEWSGAAAPGAKIIYVFSDDVFTSLDSAVTNKVAPIITISYGNCESGWGTAMLASNNLILEQANAQGQTIMSSSGDSGSTDCDVTGLATEGLNVDFPASSPYATAAGGTMFSGDLNTPANYWNNNNGSSGGSALSYIPEQPWNETTPTAGLGDSAGNGGGAGGGGASAFFAKPAWQVGTGVPNDSARDLPDFSLNAAAEHDGYLVCSSGDSTTTAEPTCTNGFLSSSGVPNVFGGTSFVAPTFAGILALVEQKLGNTTGLGNIGPTLYGFLNGPTYSSVFHDINSGSNSVPCTQGTLNCPNGGSIGYNAGTGYDQASGIGSIDVNQLINGWSSVTPTGSGSTIGAGITTTALTTSSQICAVSASSSLTLSVTVSGSISGTTPTGTVQFFVDNVAIVGGSMQLSSGTATYPLSLSSLSSGGHTISAVYSGDGNYAGSKGTLLAPANLSGVVVVQGQGSFPLYPNGAFASVDIVSGTKPDFSITNSSSTTPCGATATVLPGATASGITFVITPFNGFQGTVNLTATNQDGMLATTSFTVSPVSITTSSGVNTSFVVQASQPATAKLSKPRMTPSGRLPWYAAGSGATLAGLLLLTLPRRRRWTALLAVVLSAAALTTFGCGGSSTSNTGGGGSGGGTTPVNDAAPGTYTFTITATTSTGLVHSIQAAYTVQ
ncbi:protease pro-enzyme activation domain-containing protein [Tunturiibacter lichenicola]|uniref:protease pro-enzyme activation domain-containing protein n=1 Tax=Tunturiibacter lichenicola TaxID=2051959 RepID=UPI0021B20108|nr:protease pro-enzyme activation domain-containing protein [Edaphobacter lichenicola]